MSQKASNMNGIDGNTYYGGYSNTSGWIGTVWPPNPNHALPTAQFGGPSSNVAPFNMPLQRVINSAPMYSPNGYPLPNSFPSTYPNSAYNNAYNPMPQSNTPVNALGQTLPSNSSSSGHYNNSFVQQPSGSYLSGTYTNMATVPPVAAGSLSQQMGGLLTPANSGQKATKRSSPTVAEADTVPKRPRGRPKRNVSTVTAPATSTSAPTSTVTKVARVKRKPAASAVIVPTVVVTAPTVVTSRVVTLPKVSIRPPVVKPRKASKRGTKVIATATSTTATATSTMATATSTTATTTSAMAFTALDFLQPGTLLPPTPLPTPPPPANCPPLVTAKIPTPPNWLENMEDTVMSLLTYKTYDISPTTAEYQTLANMVYPIAVTGIEQIVNPDLWDRFAKTRTEMMRGKSDDLKILQKLGLNEREVMRCAHLSLNFDKHHLVIPYSDNMVLLFHCTRSAANHKSILSQGLDERLSAITGGLLGKGIYFADDPNKSLQYDGTGYIFVFAVLLGDCISVDHFANQRGFVREPDKVKQQMRNVNDQFFDSIAARPAGHNEYVIYNRYQCCPIYQIKYNRNVVAGPGKTNFNLASLKLPPLAWLPQGSNYALPIQDQSVNWPFFAVDLFASMGVAPPTDDDDEEIGQILPGVDDNITPQATIEENLVALINMGYNDEAKNREILANFDNDIVQTVNYLLDNATAGTGEIVQASEATPTSANNPLPATSLKEEAIVVEDDIEPSERKPMRNRFFNKSIVTVDLIDDSDSDSCFIVDTEVITKRTTKNIARRTTKKIQPQECRICCIDYESHETAPALWRFLECKHKVCLTCYSKLLTNRSTMSGVSHSFVKCPFCARCTGLEVGICPDMQMFVSAMSAPCDGYSPSPTICINYTGPNFHRIAYLPDTDDGQRVLKLLKVAFDRRLCFTVDTSHTTGQQNAMVWNIHHKTAISGGVSSHGYPDPQYLDRVREELKAYGIE